MLGEKRMPDDGDNPLASEVSLVCGPPREGTLGAATPLHTLESGRGIDLSRFKADALTLTAD